ncbi:TPA: hypothetical protein ACH3X1_003925 [Trebouxia sp. C0004]
MQVSGKFTELTAKAQDILQKSAYVPLEYDLPRVASAVARHALYQLVHPDTLDTVEYRLNAFDTAMDKVPEVCIGLDAYAEKYRAVKDSILGAADKYLEQCNEHVMDVLKEARRAAAEFERALAVQQRLGQGSSSHSGARGAFNKSVGANGFDSGNGISSAATLQRAGLNVREPLMAQSELFEQWKLSLSDAVASKHGLDQVNNQEQAVADQDIQFLEEEMQDVSVMAGQRMFTDVDMPQWWQTDPLLDITNIRLPSVSGGGTCEAEFFKIQGEMHTDEIKKHMDMLYQGVEMIRKLKDPE